MKKLSMQSVLTVYESIDELGPAEQSLCRAASAAIKLSYARYSGYRVGAAVLMESGTIVPGANQENAVYPLGLCAERVALFAACSRSAEEVVTAVAVTTEKSLPCSDVPAFPCGSCRQTLIEMETRFGRKIPLYIFKEGDVVYAVDTVRDILPFAFDDAHL